MQSAEAALTRFYTALKDVQPSTVDESFGQHYRQHFAAAMNDDFNTPLALSVLFEIASELNQAKS